jgi:hypothetical protein
MLPITYCPVLSKYLKTNEKPTIYWRAVERKRLEAGIFRPEGALISPFGARD